MHQNMVCSKIVKLNYIILVILSANQDMATSDVTFSQSPLPTRRTGFRLLYSQMDLRYRSALTVYHAIQIAGLETKTSEISKLHIHYLGHRRCAKNSINSHQLDQQCNQVYT